MAELSQAAVRLPLPRGWEGEIMGRTTEPGVVAAATARAQGLDVADAGAHALAAAEGGAGAGASEAVGSGAGAPGAALATVHAANFPLPPARGDYGSGAVEVMPFDGVFVALLEFAADSLSTPLFGQKGLPLPLDPTAFSPRQLQRPQRSQAGLQTFFTQAGRPFCLYVVIGDLNQRAALVAQANELLAGLSIG